MGCNTFLTAAALFYFLSAARAQSGLDCDSTTFVTCQQTLNKALDVGDSQPWFNPEAFRNQVESFYQTQGPKGMRTVCRAFREFKQCMGGNYTICMSPVYFVSISATVLNSYQFIGFYNQMHYICGAGLQIYLANENCMSLTWKSGGPKLNDCRSTFENNSDQLPDNACQLGNAYLTCFENQFKAGCGDKSNDAQFWGCEYARTEIFTRFPQCPIRCVLPFNGGISGLSSKNAKPIEPKF